MAVFTGIVERSLPVLEIAPSPGGNLRLDLPNVWPGEPKHGDSIAINGVCLTVARLGDDRLSFDAIPETLAKTNLGTLKAGDAVHVERALRVGDRLDGHIVQGHVDGTAEVLLNEGRGDDWRLRVSVPRDLAKYFIPKGSVTLDGVSLTIAALGDDWLEVALIPTTLEITRLGERRPGDRINVECDSMVKTIVAVVERSKRLVE